MFKKIFLLVSATVFAASSQAGELSAEAGRKLDPKLRVLLAASDFSQAPLAKSPALIEHGPGAFVRVLIKTSGGREMLRARGVRVMSMAGDIAAAIVPLERLAEMAERNDVYYIAASQSYRLFNDVGVVQTQAAAGRQQYNLSGRNIVLGCIDSGIDWRHDDFRKTTGQTRIKYLLDFSDPGDLNGDGDLDGTGPYGGTLYTEAQINAALNNTGTVNEMDRNGHGSHVMGSAAGNGRGTGNGIPPGTYAGVATEADIIFVKSSRGDVGSIPDIEIVNALAFVDSLAKVLNKPYVMNLSLGGHEGPHDGTSLQEQAIDGFVGVGKKGKAVVVAAGNDGNEKIHAGANMSGSAVNVEFEIPTYTANSGTRNDYVLFEAWYTGSASLSFQLTGPGNVTYGPVASGVKIGQDKSAGYVYLDNASTGRNPLNNDKQVVIQIFDNSANIPQSGTWRLTVTGASGRYDLWLHSATMNAALTSGFDYTRLVAIPATAKNAIAVGSWVSKKSWTDLDRNNLTIGSLVVGAASDFSNPGPTRDGRRKPDICAPGQMIGSTYSVDAPPTGANSIWKGTTQFPNGFILRDNRHAIGNGTSFAAPLIAGGVALMLERNNALDANQIRQALITTADADNFTGATPNDKWGYGKADLLGALGTFTSVSEPNAPEQWPSSFVLLPSYPNPFAQTRDAQTAMIYHVPQASRVEIAIFDVMGRKVRTLLAAEVAAGKHELRWDGRDAAGRKVSAGVYFYKMIAGKFAHARKLVVR
jgi:hypothetical protein